MVNRGYVFIGGVLIVLGLLALISSWIGVDFCALALPLTLIAVGVYLILRPRFAPPGTAVNFHFLGNVRRAGAWTPLDEELWVLIGDATFDLTQVTLPPGETVIRFLGFVGDLKLIVPDTIPVAVSSAAFLTTSRVFGNKKDTWFEPFETSAEGYAAAESKLRFESWHFITTLRLRRPED